MKETPKFTAADVAECAKQIEAAMQEVTDRRKDKYDADSALNSAECRLQNLRIKLTRAIDGQLDMGTLKQKPQTYVVETP